MRNLKYLTTRYKLTRHHLTDSGLDLTATEGVTLAPGETEVVPTGIRIELEKWYEAQVRGRSSVAKRGLLVHLGTVDAGYRGEIGVVVTNVGRDLQHIAPGERIAQLVVAKVELPEPMESLTLGEPTTRGTQGFGSTGSQS